MKETMQPTLEEWQKEWRKAVEIGAATELSPPVPCIALYPLEVLRPEHLSPERLHALQAIYAKALWRTSVSLPDWKKHNAAVKALGHCDSDDTCLAQLARLSEASHAIFAQVDLTEDGQVIAFGRVVRADGTRVIEIDRHRQIQLEQGEDSYEVVVSIVLARLFDAMEVKKLVVPKKRQQPDSLPATADEEGTAVPAHAPARLLREGMSPGRIALLTLTLTGTGVAAAIAGAIFYATANALHDVDTKGAGAANKLLRTMDTQQAVGLGFIAGGAGLVAVSLAVLALLPQGRVQHTCKRLWV